jgi:hypothetical protein
MAIRKINSRSLVDDAIATADIADGSISTAKLADDAVTTPKVAGTVNLGRRNLIINGSFQIDQRNNFTVITDGAGAAYLGDRLNVEGLAGGGAADMQVVSDSPSNLPQMNSAKVTVTTTDTSLASTDRYTLRHIIEGLNSAHLGYGTSNAKTATLSFWVKSSVTGIFSVAIANGSNNRGIAYEYTIDSANTWEKKIITVTGDTTGTWLTTSGRGIQIRWCMGCGSDRLVTAGSWAAQEVHGSTNQTNLFATNSATFQITALQFEIGDTATPFEHRSYGEELTLCQRYYEKDNPYTPTSFGGSLRGFSYHPSNGSGIAQSRDGAFTSFAVEKRATPTMTVYSYGGTSGNVSWITGGGNDSNVYTRSGPKGFQCSSSTYRNFHVWFAWTAEAEI